MRITVRTAPGVKPGLADVAKRRLEFALGRFGPRIRRLTVRLDDLNGPRGGVDQYCGVIVHLGAPRKLIVIEEEAAEAVAAIGRAADRAARAVARAVQAPAAWRVAPHGS